MKVLKIYLKSEITKVKTGTNKAGETIRLERTTPVVIPSKKNQQTPIINRHTGKSFIKQSDQYTRWKKLTKPFWDQEYIKLYNDRVRLPIARCKVNIIFYFSDDKDKDCTNKAETIMDALVDAQILADDSFKVVNNLSLKAFLCRDRPRTEIYITLIEPDDPEYNYDVTDYDRHKASIKEGRRSKYQFKKATSR